MIIEKAIHFESKFQSRDIGSIFDLEKDIESASTGDILGKNWNIDAFIHIETWHNFVDKSNIQQNVHSDLELTVHKRKEIIKYLDDTSMLKELDYSKYFWLYSDFCYREGIFRWG